MSAQIPENIKIEGKTYDLLCEPLSDYLKDKDCEFDSYISTWWRGYRGTWELKNNELYLISIEGKIKGKEVDLSYLFSDTSSVKADWFTGLLRIATGEMIHYVHGGYASIYSDELEIEIVQGNVIKTTNKHYKPEDIPPEEDLPF